MAKIVSAQNPVGEFKTPNKDTVWHVGKGQDVVWEWHPTPFQDYVINLIRQRSAQNTSTTIFEKKKEDAEHNGFAWRISFSDSTMSTDDYWLQLVDMSWVNHYESERSYFESERFHIELPEYGPSSVVYATTAPQYTASTDFKFTLTTDSTSSTTTAPAVTTIATNTTIATASTASITTPRTSSTTPTILPEPKHVGNSHFDVAIGLGISGPIVLAFGIFFGLRLRKRLQKRRNDSVIEAT